MTMQSMSYFRFAAENRRFLGFGFLLSFSSIFGQTYFVGVFGPELRADFGLGHGDWSLIYMAGTLASAVVLSWSGRLVDRVDLRVFTVVICIGLAAGCFVTAAARHVALLVAAVFLLRQFGQGLTNHVSVTSMARYFDANRGKAISLGTMGLATGEAVAPFMAVMAIAAIGWRQTYAVSGVFMVLVVIPLALWLLKGHGERHKRHVEALADPALDDIRGRQWSRAEVLRDARFYVLLVGIVAPPLIDTGIFFHILHLADVKGWSHEWVTGNYVVFAATTFVTMLVAGRLVDCIGALRLVPLHLLPLGVGLVVVSLFDASLIVTSLLLAMGITSGLGFTSAVAMWAELYGVKNIGAIKSVVTAAMVFASALGPPFMGILIDGGVAMGAICMALAAYVVVGTGLIWSALRGAAPRRASI